MPAFSLLRRFLLLAALGLAAPLARAGDAEDAAAAVNAFYAEYIATLDKSPGAGPKWIAQSPRLTPEFKAAYARAQKKGFDADPILNAQDWDPKGVRVKETVEIKGNAGVLKAGWVAPGFSEEPLVIHVRKTGAGWQIQRINSFGGPAAGARK